MGGQPEGVEGKAGREGGPRVGHEAAVGNIADCFFDETATTEIYTE